MPKSLCDINRSLTRCRRCPRLVAWREQVAREKVRRFAAETYWGRPVPSFGDPAAQLLVIGLAPAAHGGNRTGRIFTGDASGDFLYRALHKAGFASQARSISRDDGLVLTNCYVTAIAHCAPPENKLQRAEIMNCRRYLVSELKVLENLKVCVALGKVAYDNLIAAMREMRPEPIRAPKFAHRAALTTPGGITIIASYHPSQRNTQTGLLTERMLDGVFDDARSALLTRSS